jgi:hypothetical protein
MRPALVLLLFASCAHAQEQDIQRQLILRQQQSDAFTLQLRQSQELLNAPSGRRSDTESRQLSERQRLDNVNERQLREVRPDTPREQRPFERQRAEDERRPLTVPAGGIARPIEPAATLR